LGSKTPRRVGREEKKGAYRISDADKVVDINNSGRTGRDDHSGRLGWDLDGRDDNLLLGWARHVVLGSLAGCDNSKCFASV